MEKNLEPKLDNGQELSDTVVFTSAEPVKCVRNADGSLTVSGYLVRFRQEGQTDVDLYGDYFTADTDFGIVKSTPVLYNHGFDNRIKSRIIGTGELKKDDIGIWVAAQIYAHEEYKDAVAELVEQGVLGWSSGTASHLFEGKSTETGFEITRWHLGLDASLTPTPAEFRNKAVPVKTFVEQQRKIFSPDTAKEALEVSSKPEIETVKSERKPEKEMEQEKQNIEPVDSGNETVDRLSKSLDSFTQKLSALEQSIMRKAQETVRVESDVKKDVGIVTGENFDRTWLKSFVRYCINPMQGERELAAWQERYKAYKASNDTDMNIGTDADGGYTVTDSMLTRIIERRDEMSLRGKLNIRNLPGSGTTIDIPVENEDDGEWVLTSEATNSDRDTPALGQVSATLGKYTKFMPLSIELLQDTNIVALEDYLVDWAARGLAKTHNNAIITEAAANGTDLGPFAGAAAIAVDEIDDIPFNDTLGYYLDDSASVAWVMRPSTYGAIFVLDAAGNRRYATNDAGSAFGRMSDNRALIGYPVHFSNKVSAIGAGNKSVFFGNWNYMGVYEKPGFTFLRDPYGGARTGQVYLHFYTRFDYVTLQGEAIGYMDHPTA